MTPSPEKFLRARITQRQDVSADLWAIGVDPGGELAPGPRDGHVTEPQILVGQVAVANGDVPGSPAIKSRATYIAHRTYGTPRQPEAPASGSARG